MTYSGKISKYIMYIILFSVFFIQPNVNRTFQFLIAFAAIMILLLQLQLTFFSNTLEYKIKIYKVTIYRKVLTPSNIKKIKFGRIGWTTKNAVIKVRGGFNIGVAYFNSEQLILELEEFALANHIEIHKTKDYLLLEKYYTHQ